MTGCETCTYAGEHGWWGPDHRGTHCRGCHRSWAALAQSHCTDCHRHFGSNEAGDAHRVGDECRDPRGFSRYDTPDGPIFGGRDPEDMAALRARIGTGDRAQTAARGAA